MAFAVELYFDPDAQARVHDLYTSLASRGITSYLLDIGTTPHLSLAVFDDLEPEHLNAELRAFAASHAPLWISLETVGSFPSSDGVIYIAPSPSDALFQLHADFHGRLDAVGITCSPLYRPDAWIPHCTVAQRVAAERISAVTDLVRTSAAFGPAQVQRVALVAVPPVRSIYRHQLGSGRDAV